jgi:hypothetical protein
VGQYATGAIFGALNDAKGPGLYAFKGCTESLLNPMRSVSLCAAVLLASGYGLMAFALKHLFGNWLFLAAYYLLCGAGTSACCKLGHYTPWRLSISADFASLSTSVKTFPRHSGLAIGVPCALFGLSPLIMSSVGANFFTNLAGDLDAVAFLTFLACACLAINIFSAFGLREPEAAPFADKNTADEAQDETQPLLGSPDEQPANPLRAFLSDREAWVFALAFLLAAGPSEGIQASLGSIVEALLSVHTQDGDRPWPSQSALQARSHQVQLFALCNTLARLGAGALSDVICPVAGSTRRRRISRLWIYALSTTQLSLVLLWAVARLRSIDQLYGLSIASGLNYGIAFSITPSIIANRWGLRHFGLHWGLVVLACGVGSCLFTELFGWVSDINAAESTLCHGPRCFRASFAVAAVSLACVTVRIHASEKVSTDAV